jgi:hypothetical protein
VADDHQDRDRLRRGRAGRREGPPGRDPGHFDWDDVGDFASLAKLNSHGRKNDLAILGENARILSDAASGIVISQTNRVISLIGCATSSSSTPRMHSW